MQKKWREIIYFDESWPDNPAHLTGPKNWKLHAQHAPWVGDETFYFKGLCFLRSNLLTHVIHVSELNENFLARCPNFLIPRKINVEYFLKHFFPQNILIDTQNDALKTLSSLLSQKLDVLRSRCTICKKKTFPSKIYISSKSSFDTMNAIFTTQPKCLLSDGQQSLPENRKKNPASAFEEVFSQKKLMDTYFALQMAEAKSLCPWSKLILLIIWNFKKILV